MALLVATVVAHILLIPRSAYGGGHCALRGTAATWAPARRAVARPRLALVIQVAMAGGLGVPARRTAAERVTIFRG